MRISDWSSDVCSSDLQECWLAHERPILSDVCLDAEVEFRKFQHVTSTGADEVLTLAILHRLDGAFGGQLLEIVHFALAHHLALAALHNVPLFSDSRMVAQDGHDGNDPNAPLLRRSLP